MNHVIDRIIDWIKTNGDGKKFTVTSKDGPDLELIAGWQECDDYELLHIGHYRTVNGKACGDPEIVLQIRGGEFTCMVTPDTQEDGEFLDRLIGIYERHMAACSAPF